MVGLADEEEAGTEFLTSSEEQILLEIATELQVEAGESSVHPERMLRLDKFAAVYVQDWLKNLAEAREIVPLPPPPWPVDLSRQAEIFPTPLLYQAYPYLDRQHVLPDLRELKSTETIDDFPQLDGSYAAYHRRFNNLLVLELQELERQAGQQVMYGVQIVRHRAKTPPTNSYEPVIWKLRVPGTREDSPQLQINDKIRIRGLYRSVQTASKVSIQARITGTIKREGLVFFDCPAMLNMEQSLLQYEGDANPLQYLVEFYPSSDSLFVMQNALRRMTACLAPLPKSGKRSLATKWLFPMIEDAQETTSSDDVGLLPYPYKEGSGTKLQPPLNEHQRLAIQRVVSAHRTVPYLIVGPPGTGKTKTMVELVLQILVHNPDAHVLVTAPSNPAADTLTLRLMRYLDNNTMLRLQGPERTFAETPSNIMTYSCVQDDRFAVPEWDELLSYRVVVVNCVDAELLVMAKATNAEMFRLERSTASALRSKNLQTPLRPHWTHLLVDEAGQASEPELLVPISVVSPGPTEDALCRTAEPQMVICGDVKQLPAIIHSAQARDHALDVSLMERLQERAVYDLKANAQSKSVNIIRLAFNYRSHPGILLLPSTIFYNDILEPVADIALSRWNGLPNPAFPMLIRGVESEEDWIDEGASYFNRTEIEEVLVTVRSLISQMDRPYAQSDIGVITPWREQVWRIRLKLREAGFGDINVGNVEAYQGAEYQCVILSCVRSRQRFLYHDRKSNMGLINEPKRFNVAITRAKELMIIIGNMNCHKIDSYWRGLLQIAHRHGLYRGPALENFEITGEYLSRLESRFFHPHHNDDISLEGLLISGAAAREALTEDD